MQTLSPFIDSSVDNVAAAVLKFNQSLLEFIDIPKQHLASHRKHSN